MDRNTAENLAIIRRIVYDRIKMATGGGEPPSFGKRKCIYDDTFRKQTLFSC